MKSTRIILVLSLVLLAALVLSACGPKDTGPVTFNITGLVDNPLALTDIGLHNMSVATATLEHPKNGPTEYTGVKLSDLLDEANLQAGAATLTLTGSDGYTYDIAVTDAQACSDCMLAFTETSGVYNLAMPGLPGKAWVKGIASIEVK